MVPLFFFNAFLVELVAPKKNLLNPLSMPNILFCLWLLFWASSTSIVCISCEQPVAIPHLPGLRLNSILPKVHAHSHEVALSETTSRILEFKDLNSTVGSAWMCSFQSDQHKHISLLATNSGWRMGPPPTYVCDQATLGQSARQFCTVLPHATGVPIC